MINTFCVYAIFSHTRTNQVLRLVRALRRLSPNSVIVIHHDPGHEALDANACKAAGALIIPLPIRGEWGDYSLVQQHIHTMQWCMQNINFEWFITLTGQSYPIKPLDNFEAFLKNTHYEAFLSHFSAYDDNIWPNKEAVYRYHYRYAKIPKFHYWHKLPRSCLNWTNLLIKHLNNIQPLFHIFRFPRNLNTRIGILQKKRPFSPTSTPLFGANLNTNYKKNAIESIFRYLNANPEYSDYFSKTIIPDEVFFINILKRLQDIHVANDHLRYVYWPSINAESAGVMNLQHLAELINSPAFFGLKFDETKHPELLDTIDKELGLVP